MNNDVRTDGRRALRAGTSGQQLIDDDYLRTRGAIDEDIARYRYDPKVEPPRLLAGEAAGAEGGGGGGGGDWDVRRGDVRQLRRDKARSKL